MTIAQEVMTKAVVSISPHAAVAEAIQVMRDRHVTSLLVERRSK
jgi:CBS domain-containing protein